ncbi:hypothetical protein KVR01_009968 [Diaporthe batatas]|uniref:uncharacterized protein n=1 Tax=Diaporthe batatas TaxID=748121 RepID=UPI001D041A35|nr:uncharacterized protein KVR01_009968 [Diaporthe batatas]KAG8160432.1 hypothetical protein KVR01_009968 [Diaporthe batatas]
MTVLAASLDPPTANKGVEKGTMLFEEDQDYEEDKAVNNPSRPRDRKPRRPVADNSPLLWGPPDLSSSSPLSTHTPAGTRLRRTPTPRSALIFVPQSPKINMFPFHHHHETDLIRTRYDDGEVVRYGAGESYRPFNSGSSNTRDRSPRRARSPLRDRDRDPTFQAGRRVAAPGVLIATGDSTEVVTLLAVVRAGDDGTAAVAAPEVLSGALHLEGAPDGLHHATRLPRDGMIGFQIEHGPHAVTLTAETLDEDHDPRSIATAVTGRDLLSGALLQLDLEATDLTDRDRALQTAWTVAMTGMAQARVTDSAHLSESEKSFPQPSHRARIRAGLSGANSIPVPARTSTPRAAAEPFQTPLKSPQRAKSPPRGPAALRAPPTGPSAARNFSTPHAAPAALRSTPAPSYSSRADTPSPTVPPSGPRGYGPPRGNSFSSRGRGGGGWGTPASRPHFAPAPAASPATPPTGPSSVPTGPRASFSSRDTPAPSPSVASKPFNPPTGPAAQGGQRQSLAQNLIASMPHMVPGGKLDPASTPLMTGVTKDLEAHHRRLKEEEERIREELKVKDEKLRKSLRVWEKLERESKSFELKSDLSENSLRTIAGEGVGGAAF